MNDKNEKPSKKPSDHTRQDDIDEAVLAADDTGMVRNEADIIMAEIAQTEEGDAGKR